MYTDGAIAEALEYFSKADHPNSYEIREGCGTVLLSAPHAVFQTRNGAMKAAERYTGMLCLLLHNRYGYPCIFKTGNRNDDANFDPHSDYRDALCAFVKQNGIRCVLDLHQLHPDRPMDLCLGTGQRANLLGQDEIVTIVQAGFQAWAFGPITVDKPFAASGKNTVCATVTRTCAIPSLLIELNSRLLMEDHPKQRFQAMMDALNHICQELNQRFGGQ